MDSPQNNLNDRINRILEEEERRLKRKKYKTDAPLLIAVIVFFLSVLIANYIKTHSYLND